jgi:mannosyltransferase
LGMAPLLSHDLQSGLFVYNVECCMVPGVLGTFSLLSSGRVLAVCMRTSRRPARREHQLTYHGRTLIWTARSSEGCSLSRGWAFRLACLAVILLAAGLRLHQLNANSLWYDEIAQATWATKLTAFETVRVHLAHPNAPLDPLITHAVMYLGRSEYLLRFPAVCFSVLTVALCFALGRAMFGPREGLIAAFLLAVSWFHIRYAQEVRTYALLVFLGSLSLWFFWRSLRSDRSYDWLAWIVLGPLSLCAHPFAALWVLAHGIFGVTAGAFARWLGPDVPGRSTQRKKVLLGVSLTLVGAGVQFALGSANYMQQVRMGPGAISSIAARWMTVTRQLLVGFGNGVPMGSLFIVIIVFACFILVRQSKDRPTIWLLTLSCLVPWLFALFTVIGRQTFYLRYILFMLPPYLLLGARGATGVMDLVAAQFERISGGRVSVGSLSLALIMVVFGVPSITPVRAYYASRKADWRSVGRYLSEHVQAGDIVIADGVRPRSAGDEEWTLRCLLYYFSPEEQGALLVPVTGIGRHQDADQTRVISSPFLGDISHPTVDIAEVSNPDAHIWTVVYHPRRLSKTDRADLHWVGFPEVTIFRLAKRQRPLHDLLSILQELLVLQTNSQGEFDVHLALARVYAMNGQFSRARTELRAARSQQPHLGQAKEAFLYTREYVNRRKQ